MPFPEGPGGVPRAFLEELGHERVIQIDAARDARRRVEVHPRLLADMPRHTTGHKRGARRRAEAVDVVLGELDGVLHERVDLRRLDLRELVVPPDVVEAQVVDQHDYARERESVCVCAVCVCVPYVCVRGLTFCVQLGV